MKKIRMSKFETSTKLKVHVGGKETGAPFPADGIHGSALVPILALVLLLAGEIGQELADGILRRRY
jgi:hypothetical protein